MQQGVWTKSSRCKADQPSCVEVMSEGDSVLVRDGDGALPLLFTADEWRVFVAGVRAGDFDLQ